MRYAKAVRFLMLIGSLIFAVVILTTVFGTTVFVEQFAQHLRRAGRRERPAVSDTGIVLGAYTDGYRPSLPLRSRLHSAIHLYRHGVVRTLIVSGGQGEDEIVTESRSMKRFLALNGIPPEVIFEDRTSKDTWENLRNSQRVMNAVGLKTAVIITSDYHLPRALAVARRLDIQATGFAAHSTRREFHSAMREVFAHIQYTLRGRQSLF
ncbi:YdcF family protein [Alicyclobacillus dauci]|uniref:YdcF family protein n=1 Tax=Alicyclobacillus dauci TaxID=1475485 RepID=A0ABY6Z7I4_9BACL|nr:YdcF family protein [Alicyclobacillus dauci]WAH38557.1 YdcF family protein [Alicyclobacillus dauci]